MSRSQQTVEEEAGKRICTYVKAKFKKIFFFFVFAVNQIKQAEKERDVFKTQLEHVQSLLSQRDKDVEQLKFIAESNEQALVDLTKSFDEYKSSIEPQQAALRVSSRFQASRNA